MERTISEMIGKDSVNHNTRAFIGVLAIVGDLLYSIRCTIVVQWHFYAIF